MLETDGRHEVVAGVSNGIAALEASERLLPDLVRLSACQWTVLKQPNTF